RGPWRADVTPAFGTGKTSGTRCAAARSRKERPDSRFHPAGRAAKNGASATALTPPGQPRPTMESTPMTAPTHHPLGYVEFAVRGLARARLVSGEALGWQLHAYGPECGRIRSADGSRGTGGLALAEEAREGGPLPVLFCLDREARRSAVLKAGGTLEKD